MNLVHIMLVIVAWLCALALAILTIRLHGIINDLAEENGELRVRLARHVMLEAPCAAEKLAGINKEGE